MMHCRFGGGGFSLVLVHGYLGCGGQWREQLQHPPPGIRVIAPCLPGFGDSAKMPPPQSIGEFARAMLDFLATKGVVNFYLLGHSMGGMIAQEMTKQAPDKVAALVLYGTGPIGAIPGRFETMAASRRRLLKDGDRKMAARMPAKWLVGGANSPHYAFVAAMAKKTNLAGHLAGLTAMEKWDGQDALSAIACPTLIIWGDKDQSYPRAQINLLRDNIAGAALKVIPGASHLAHLEFPGQFNDALRDFLCGVAGDNPACGGGREKLGRPV